MFMCALVRGRLKAPFNSTAEALLLLDGSKKLTEEFYAKPIKDIIPACRKVIDNMIEMNQLHTWHPDVKKHFEHIFTLMRPHFVERDLSYVSYLGMPEHGNPLYECRTKEDWELTYEDYKTTEGVKEWFSIRTDLFFNLLKPADEVIKRLDNHFLAFLIPYNCECGQGITMQWASCFANEFKVSCGFCGQEKMLPREDFSIHVIRKEDQ